MRFVMKIDDDNKDVMCVEGYGGYPSVEEIEKFAELIVQECANIISNKSTLEINEDYREGFHKARQFLYQDIKQHFGVEE